MALPTEWRKHTLIVLSFVSLWQQQSQTPLAQLEMERNKVDMNYLGFHSLWCSQQFNVFSFMPNYSRTIQHASAKIFAIAKALHYTFIHIVHDIEYKLVGTGEKNLTSKDESVSGKHKSEIYETGTNVLCCLRPKKPLDRNGNGLYWNRVGCERLCILFGIWYSYTLSMWDILSVLSEEIKSRSIFHVCEMCALCAKNSINIQKL